MKSDIQFPVCSNDKDKSFIQETSGNVLISSGMLKSCSVDGINSDYFDKNNIIGILILTFIGSNNSIHEYNIKKMDQYIKTIISVGGGAVMLVMIVCVLWYVVKDTWKDINSNSKD